MASRLAAWAAAALMGASACAGGAGRGLGSAAEARFDAGNAAYERGAWLEAAAVYQEMIASGAGTAAVHYNLGNALFKAGRLGPAVAAYERARRLAPGDPDVRANLEYLNALIVDRISSAPSPWSALGLTYVLDLTSPDQDAAVFLAAWLLAGAAGAAALAASSPSVRKAARYAAAALAIPALFSGGALALKIYAESAREEAVVTEPEVNVLSGAGEENPTLFTVHEGLKVRIHARSGGWAQVSLPNGLAGWLPESAAEVI